MCNIDGQSKFSIIANFSIDCNIRKCLSQNFFTSISLSKTVIYPAILLCLLLAALIHSKPKVHNVATISAFALFSVTCIHSRTVSWLYGRFLILRNGDVEIHPGPRHNSGGSFSICHWNLNSVSAYNYTKLSSLKSFIAVHKFDTICLSETYLDSSLATDNKNLKISADHSSNNKRGGVCVYHKNILPL